MSPPGPTAGCPGPSQGQGWALGVTGALPSGDGGTAWPFFLSVSHKWTSPTSAGTLPGWRIQALARCGGFGTWRGTDGIQSRGTGLSPGCQQRMVALCCWPMRTSQAVAVGGQGAPQPKVTAALSGGQNQTGPSSGCSLLALPCALCCHGQGFPRAPAATG